MGQGFACIVQASKCQASTVARELMLTLQASDWGWNDVQIEALELYSGGQCAIAASSPVVH